MATCPDHRKHGVGCGCVCAETDFAAKRLASTVHCVVLQRAIVAVALEYRVPLLVLFRFIVSFASEA